MHFKHSLLTPESIKTIWHTLPKKDEKAYFVSLNTYDNSTCNRVINYLLWKQTDHWLLPIFLPHTANNVTEDLTWITISWSKLQAEVQLDYFQRNPSKQPLGWTTNMRAVPLDSNEQKLVPWFFMHWWWGLLWDTQAGLCWQHRQKWRQGRNVQRQPGTGGELPSTPGHKEHVGSSK